MKMIHNQEVRKRLHRLLEQLMNQAAHEGDGFFNYVRDADGIDVAVSSHADSFLGKVIEAFPGDEQLGDGKQLMQSFERQRADVQGTPHVHRYRFAVGPQALIYQADENTGYLCCADCGEPAKLETTWL